MYANRNGLRTERYIENENRIKYLTNNDTKTTFGWTALCSRSGRAPEETRYVPNEFTLFATGVSSLMNPTNFSIQAVLAKYALLYGVNWNNIDYNYNLFLNMYMMQESLPASKDKYFNAELNLTNNPQIWKRIRNNWTDEDNGIWKPKKVE